jgi:hypothetical protein
MKRVGESFTGRLIEREREDREGILTRGKRETEPGQGKLAGAWTAMITGGER